MLTTLLLLLAAAPADSIRIEAGDGERAMVEELAARHADAGPCDLWEAGTIAGPVSWDTEQGMPDVPEAMKHWTLTSLQTRLIKTGGRLVRHARRLVFQLAEVLVTRKMLTGILERISQLRLASG